MKVNDSSIKSDNYKDFSTPKKNPTPAVSKTAPEEKRKKVNLPVLATTVAGTLLPMMIIRKYQGLCLKKGALKDMAFMTKTKTVLKSINIEYGLKEMLFTSLGSVLGGLSGGLLFNKNETKENKKNKIKESVFQLSNIAVTTSLVAGLLAITEKSKKLKGALPKIAAVVVGSATGMPLASAVSNKINNSIVDKENPVKRKMALKDCFVHIDDLFGALVLSKFPFADKLHVDKIIPALSGVCGYEVGVEK